MKSIERIADFVSHAAGQESECVETLALDGFAGLLTDFGAVMQDECEAGAAGGLAIEWG